jgi:hypothetical protein
MHVVWGSVPRSRDSVICGVADATIVQARTLEKGEQGAEVKVEENQLSVYLLLLMDVHCSRV